MSCLGPEDTSGVGPWPGACLNTSRPTRADFEIQSLISFVIQTMEFELTVSTFLTQNQPTNIYVQVLSSKCKGTQLGPGHIFIADPSLLFNFQTIKSLIWGFGRSQVCRLSLDVSLSAAPPGLRLGQTSHRVCYRPPRPVWGLSRSVCQWLGLWVCHTSGGRPGGGSEATPLTLVTLASSLSTPRKHRESQRHFNS